MKTNGKRKANTSLENHRCSVHAIYKKGGLLCVHKFQKGTLPSRQTQSWGSEIWAGFKHPLIPSARHLYTQPNWTGWP